MVNNDARDMWKAAFAHRASPDLSNVSGRPYRSGSRSMDSYSSGRLLSDDPIAEETAAIRLRETRNAP